MTTIPTNNSLALGQQPQVGQMLAQAHGQAKAMFDQTSKGLAHLQTMNAALQKMVKLGDTITPDEVISEAGGLVASGTHSANEMAVLLSQMPQGSQALAAWIQGHLQQNMQATQQLAQMHALARHEMGASGLRLLQHVSQQGLASAGGALAVAPQSGEAQSGGGGEAPGA